MSEPYTFRGFTIPAHMMPALLRWTQNGEVPGDFLQAVIRNDLRAAVSHADNENAANLPAYLGWFYNEAPCGCWGAPGCLTEWPGRLEAMRPKVAA